MQRWGLDAHAHGGAWNTCTRWLLRHIHANCTCHEAVRTETVIASHWMCSFSMESEVETLRPCRGWALMPMHKVELGADAQGGS